MRCHSVHSTSWWRWIKVKSVSNIVEVLTKLANIYQNCIMQLRKYATIVSKNKTKPNSPLITFVSVCLIIGNFTTSIDGVNPNQHPSLSLLKDYLNDNGWKTVMIEGDLSCCSRSSKVESSLFLNPSVLIAGNISVIVIINWCQMVSFFCLMYSQNTL